jgi:hypothetical protein
MATRDEIRMALDAERDELYWIAYLITGDPVLARKCLIDASGLSSLGSGVLHDWVSRWAAKATARVAVESVREVLVLSSQEYATRSCEHPSHELLPETRVEFIRQLDPHRVISDLDPFPRAILVLRGTQEFSISECALLLEVPRKSVVAAYCHALRWISKNTGGVSSCAISFDPLSEILDGEE